MAAAYVEIINNAMFESTSEKDEDTADSSASANG